MPDEIDWALTTWAGNRRRQHLEFQQLTFSEKLAAIEQLGGVGAMFSRRGAHTHQRESTAAQAPGGRDRAPSDRAPSLAHVRSNREQIENLAHRHGISRVRVFGSVARGEAGAVSDLDLLVDTAPERSLFDLIAFWQDVEELLGLHVHVVTDGGVSPYLRDRIYAEALPL